LIEAHTTATCTTRQHWTMNQNIFVRNTASACKWCMLNCPHNEMKLKQNGFNTVLKLFWNCFVSAKTKRSGR